MPKKCEGCGVGINGGTDPPTCHICQKAIDSAEAILENSNEEEEEEANEETAETVDEQQQNQPTIIQVSR